MKWIPVLEVDFNSPPPWVAGVDQSMKEHWDLKVGDRVICAYVENNGAAISPVYAQSDGFGVEAKIIEVYESDLRNGYWLVRCKPTEEDGT